MAPAKTKKAKGVGLLNGVAARSFTFDGGDGYSVRIKDYGTGGIHFEMLHPDGPAWDRVSGAMLDSGLIDNFLLWLSSTSGRPIMVLPQETMAVLKGLLEITKGSNRVPKEDRRVLRRAIKALNHLYTQSSLAQRALNR